MNGHISTKAVTIWLWIGYLTLIAGYYRSSQMTHFGQWEDFSDEKLILIFGVLCFVIALYLLYTHFMYYEQNKVSDKIKSNVLWTSGLAAYCMLQGMLFSQLWMTFIVSGLCLIYLTIQSKKLY